MISAFNITLVEEKGFESVQIIGIAVTAVVECVIRIGYE